MFIKFLKLLNILFVSTVFFIIIFEDYLIFIELKLITNAHTS
jgi:hypothetical protein